MKKLDFKKFGEFKINSLTSIKGGKKWFATYTASTNVLSDAAANTYQKGSGYFDNLDYSTDTKLVGTTVQN